MSPTPGLTGLLLWAQDALCHSLSPGSPGPRPRGSLPTPSDTWGCCSRRPQSITPSSVMCPPTHCPPSQALSFQEVTPGYLLSSQCLALFCTLNNCCLWGKAGHLETLNHGLSYTSWQHRGSTGCVCSASVQLGETLYQLRYKETQPHNSDFTILRKTVNTSQRCVPCFLWDYNFL